LIAFSLFYCHAQNGSSPHLATYAMAMFEKYKSAKPKTVW